MPHRFLDGPNGRVAYEKTDGEGPCVVWLGGFRSDMTGTKATHLEAWAQNRGRAFLRFDYSGHGASDGEFRDGAISIWLDDAAAAIDALTDGPIILVGSSMGGWIAGLLTRTLSDRLAGLVLIAPAPDFTETLMWPNLGPGARRSIEEDGACALPSLYDQEPTIITKKLIEDGRRNLLLGAPLAYDGPVRILQGMADPEVPWRHAVQFAETITSDDVRITLTKSGDHRLSTPDDLQRLTDTLDAL
ncbi:MAG: alpha/beta hydrolase [Pseudomonadota bacterium]